MPLGVESHEEPIVDKKVRTDEEVAVRKGVKDRTETVRDTVRETKVDVEKSGAAKGAGIGAGARLMRTRVAGFPVAQGALSPADLADEMKSTDRVIRKAAKKGNKPRRERYASMMTNLARSLEARLQKEGRCMSTTGNIFYGTLFLIAAFETGVMAFTASYCLLKVGSVIAMIPGFLTLAGAMLMCHIADLGVEYLKGKCKQRTAYQKSAGTTKAHAPCSPLTTRSVKERLYQ